ncbi:MAG: RNA polymerase sigma factor [Betaproteobacteria bacterium]
MKISEPDPTTLRDALKGSLQAVDALITTIQPGVYKLAVHVLGHRDDAADATQEILLKIVTHLSAFRSESALSTWVWRVAYNHLMTAKTRKAESPEVSLDAIAERLEQGLEFAAHITQSRGDPGPLTPQDKLEARQVALSCTQSMLMALDREQRLAYVIDTVFNLDSREAAAVVGISPEAYRQRVSRARARLDAFMSQSCGLSNPDATCRCERQLPAVRHLSKLSGVDLGAVVALHKPEMEEAERQFAAFTRVADSAAILRAHPDYQAPEAQRAAILAVLRQEGFMQGSLPQ